MKFLPLAILSLFLSVSAIAQSLDSYVLLKDTTLKAEPLSYNKHLQITVPKVYQANAQQKFPLIVIFDMQNSSIYKYILNTIDHLTSLGAMPASIVVGIEAGEGSKRYRETQFDAAFPGMTGEKNDDYLFKNLIPMVKQQYKASNFLMFIGHSRYGFFTSYLLAKHLNEINAVISLSPFLLQENEELHKKIDILQLLTDATKTTTLKHTVYYRFSMGSDYPADYKKLNEAIQTGQIQNKLLNASGEWFPHADHLLTPGLTIAKALTDIFDYWNAEQVKYITAKEISSSTINAAHASIKAHYGSDVNFSLSYLNGTGWAFYNDKKYDLAIIAWQEMLKYYPNYSEGFLNIAKCEKKLNQSTTATLKLFKESLASSTFLDAKQKEGLLKDAEEL